MSEWPWTLLFKTPERCQSESDYFNFILSQKRCLSDLAYAAGASAVPSIDIAHPLEWTQGVAKTIRLYSTLSVHHYSHILSRISQQQTWSETIFTSDYTTSASQLVLIVVPEDTLGSDMDDVNDLGYGHPVWHFPSSFEFFQVLYEIFTARLSQDNVDSYDSPKLMPQPPPRPPPITEKPQTRWDKCWPITHRKMDQLCEIQNDFTV